MKKRPLRNGMNIPLSRGNRGQRALDNWARARAIILAKLAAALENNIITRQEFERQQTYWIALCTKLMNPGQWANKDLFCGYDFAHSASENFLQLAESFEAGVRPVSRKEPQIGH